MRQLAVILITAFFTLHQVDSVAQGYPQGACVSVPGSQSCIDSTPCKLDSSGKTVCLAGVIGPSGFLAVPQTCWEYSYQYSCKEASSVDTCSTASWWNAKTCSQTAVSCANTVPETGACSSYNYSYSCMTSPAKSSQAMSCNSNLFNSDQFIAPPNPNSSFGKAAVAMEIARQTQVYADCSSGDPAACLNAAIFVGTPEKCTKGYAGLRNCCNSSPGAQSNSDLMSTIGFGVGGKVAMFAGEKAVDAASPYVFDAMYSGATYVGGLTNSMSTVTSMLGSSAPAGTSLASGGVSAYGLTYGSTTAFAGGGLGGGNIALTGGALAETTSTAAAAAATTAGETASLAMSANAAATAAEATAMATGAAADMAAATIAQNAAFAAAETAATAATASTAAAAGAAEAASSVLMFNPYTFAIAIAITLITTYIMSLMSCTKEEQVLAMHKGANLSVFTGQSCTKKLPAIGTCMEYTDTYCSFNSVLAKLINQQGKAQLDLNFASCTGLTVAQISKLDFSKINLSEFVNTMVAKATSNLPTSVPTNYAPLVQNTTTGSAQSGSNGTGYPVGYKP